MFLRGEEAAKQDLTGEGLAEGVDGCDGDEPGEFEEGGDDDGDGCEGLRAEFGEDCGEEPVEGDGPEYRTQVFIEEPREVEREITYGQADGDGNEEQKETDDTADRVSWSHALCCSSAHLWTTDFGFGQMTGLSARCFVCYPASRERVGEFEDWLVNCCCI
jgi:hypothetical protein